MSDLGDRIFGKVGANADVLSKIMSKIPGFSGYNERQNRREADKLLRMNIANQFEQAWQRVSGLQREFISQGEIGMVDDLEAAAIKLRTFADRISRATYGYSGLFDKVQINQAELAQLYQYDVTLLSQVDEINRAVDNVETSVGSDGLPAAIRHLTSLSAQAVETYNQRENAIVTGDLPVRENKQE